MTSFVGDVAWRRAPSSPQRGEGGPKGRMRGCAKRQVTGASGHPLIASHALGTSPRGGEEGDRGARPIQSGSPL